MAEIMIEDKEVNTSEVSTSHHIFLCPMNLGDTRFGSVDLKRKCGEWSEFRFEIDTAEDYSEKEYFYRFASAAMFDSGGPVKRYRHNIYSKQNNGKYEFEFGSKTYVLNIEDVILNVYETGIGILSFHLDNDSLPDLKDIKVINDVGRRMFPAFLSGSRDGTSWTNAPMKTFLPSYIRLLSDNPNPITTRFDTFASNEKINSRINENSKYADYRIPSFIRELFEGLTIDANKLSLLIDDRMFVLSWIGNTELANKLAEGITNYTESEDWHNLLFCDKGANSNHKNEAFRNALNEKHSYTRWLGYGSIYGVSRYSFVLLTIKDEYSDVFKVHLTTLYFQMVQLCLVQRASILKFSNAASNLASHIKTSFDDEDNNRLSNLQINYVRFINRLYFREVTAQEQGIDLYNMLQTHMRIPEQLKELDTEINEMVQLQNLLKNQEDNKLLKQLTIIATIFLVPALITGLLGMNVVDMSSFLNNGLGVLIFSALAVVTFLISAYSIGQLIITSSMGKALRNLKLNLILILLVSVLILSTVGVLIKQLA